MSSIHNAWLSGSKTSWRERKQGASTRGDRLAMLENLAYWLDSAFRIPLFGTRIGLDAIIGLVPGIGDAITSIASLFILHAASRYGVPRVTLAHGSQCGDRFLLRFNSVRRRSVRRLLEVEHQKRGAAQAIPVLHARRASASSLGRSLIRGRSLAGRGSHGRGQCLDHLPDHRLDRSRVIRCSHALNLAWRQTRFRGRPSPVGAAKGR